MERCDRFCDIFVFFVVCSGCSAIDLPGQSGSSSSGVESACEESLWDDEAHPLVDIWQAPPNCDAVARSWSCSLQNDEQKVVELLNQARLVGGQCGDIAMPAVAMVEMDPLLQCAARLHSWDMQWRQYFSHYTPEGLGPMSRGGAVGAVAMAENIFKLWGGPESAIQGWLASPGHCHNMLQGRYLTIGVGRYGGYYTMKLAP